MVITQSRIALFILLFCSGMVFSQNYSRVKIYADAEGLQKLAELGLPVDHGIYKKNTFFISDFSAEDITVLREQGYSYEMVIEDVQAFYVAQNSADAPVQLKNSSCGNGTISLPAVPQNFSLGSMGGYFTYEEMLSELDQMAALYPNLITIKAPISTFLTHENRPIYHVKISDNPAVNETEPSVLYTAIHHAREPLSMSQTIFYMWYLLENYNTNAEVKYLVDNTQLFFVPCLNPDGYIQNQTTNPNGGGMHRKNKRNVGTTNKGVDLNRNYSYGWGTTGISFSTNSDTYPGTGAFSEPETQAIRWLVQNQKFVSAFNAHTFGDMLLYPIGTTTNEFADHHDYFSQISQIMVEQNGYFPQKSSGLYPASGDSDDYMYKQDMGIGVKDTIFAFTPEIGNSFWPAQTDIIPTCQEMVHSNLMLAHMALSYLKVTDTSPNTILTNSGVWEHNVYKVGVQSGSVNVSIEPVLNIQSIGSPINYNLTTGQSTTGSFTYVLSPTIASGDQIKYVLKADYGTWISRDTIVKTFGLPTIQFVDNGSTAANWTGSWSTTSSQFVSPSTSYTESVNGNYTNNSNKVFQLNPTIDLTQASAAQISFHAKWDIETDYDYCQFQVSTDNGASWIGQCGLYTVPGNSANGSVQPNNQPVYEGVQSDWVIEEINLSEYLGQQIKVRFQFRSDGGVVEDGFYFDDFQVAFTESAASLHENDLISLVHPNPAHTAVTVHLTKNTSNGLIQVFDYQGKCVLTHRLEGQTSTPTLPIHTLKNGVYSIRMESDGVMSLPVKLIVLN